jgi:hypothetical protein
MDEQSGGATLSEALENHAAEPAEKLLTPEPADWVGRIAVVELASGHCLVGPQADLQAMIDRGEARLASAFDLDISQNLVRYI